MLIISINNILYISISSILLSEYTSNLLIFVCNIFIMSVIFVVLRLNCNYIKMTVKNMHSDLDISLFQVKNWEEILGEEFYMTNPLVRYILLAILLLVLFLRTLSWLQYLYLKRELKKRFTKLV